MLLCSYELFVAQGSSWRALAFSAGGDGGRRSPEHLARAGRREHLGWIVLNPQFSDY